MRKWRLLCSVYGSNVWTCKECEQYSSSGRVLEIYLIINRLVDCCQVIMKVVKMKLRKDRPVNKVENISEKHAKSFDQVEVSSSGILEVIA